MTGDTPNPERAVQFTGHNHTEIRELAGTLPGLATGAPIPRYRQPSVYNPPGVWCRDTGWTDLWPGCWVVHGRDGALGVTGHYDPESYQRDLDVQRQAQYVVQRASLGVTLAQIATLKRAGRETTGPGDGAAP